MISRRTNFGERSKPAPNRGGKLQSAGGGGGSQSNVSPLCQLCRLSRQGKPGQVNANLIDFSSGLEIENDTIKFKVGCVLSFDS